MTTPSLLARSLPGVRLPVAIDEVIALDPSAIAEQLGDPHRARRWISTLAKNTPDALVPQLELSRLIVLLDQSLPGSAVPGLMDVESAIARGDWQAAYDAAIRNTQPSGRALAGLLLLVDALTAADQPDAALDLLSRALDLYEGTPAVYWALIQVLSRQGRFDDAEAALTLLRESLQAA